MKPLSIFNSNSPWRFLLHVLVFLLPLLVAILYFYFSFYVDRKDFRDIQRLGMVRISNYKNCVDTLTDDFSENVRFSEAIDNLDSMAIYTIGDSFSQQNIRGYQNYLAHISNLKNVKVINIDRSPSCGVKPEEFFLIMCCQSAKLPRVIILESVERAFVGRLNSLNFSQPIEEEKIQKSFENQEKYRKVQAKSFLEQVQEFYKKRLGIDNPICHFSLSKDVFSCAGRKRDLYVINSSLDSDLRMPKTDEIMMAQTKLDSLFRFAAAHNVELYYMVAMDKYDAYQEFIDEDHPKKETLDLFATAFNNNPYFVNTKRIILPVIQSGEKDMYYCDDTHWSTKSAKLVAEEFSRRIFE